MAKYKDKVDLYDDRGKVIEKASAPGGNKSSIQPSHKANCFSSKENNCSRPRRY